MSAPEIEGVDMSDYVTEQVFYPSADGTKKIPMFITYKKGLERNGKNPVYLYGYGGFNVSLPPSFSPQRLLWLENGGIYAQANLRGGSEYGEAWHQAGTKTNKLNVFNDFIAAAEYMIGEGGPRKTISPSKADPMEACLWALQSTCVPIYSKWPFRGLA